MTTSKTINLIEIGNQLALTAKGLQKKVDDSNEALNISASLLLGKIPDLKIISEKSILRLKKTEDGYKCDTPSTWLDDSGEVVFCYTDFSPMEDFTAIKHKSGISGWVDVKHKSGLILRIGITVSESHLEDLEVDESDGYEGDGMPLPSYLRLIPQPETPLYDSKLPHNVEFTIISNGKFSRKYQTPLVTIKSENGEIFKDVICNSSLNRIYKNYGNGAKFKIVSKHPKRNKKGETVNANGEPSSNHAWIVNILDCQSVDFSDL
jgi:hypothetical protein